MGTARMLKTGAKPFVRAWGAFTYCGVHEMFYWAAPRIIVVVPKERNVVRTCGSGLGRRRPSYVLDTG